VFDQDEQEISQIIESGIEAILAGRSTLEQVLAEHPGQAEEIRGELEGALWLMSRQSEVEARPGFVGASRKRVMERIKAEASSQGTRRAFLGFAWPQKLAFQWIVGMVVLISVLTSTGSMLTISQSSLPGEDLYPIKRAAEQMTYSVALSGVQRVELSTEYTDRRLDEAKALIDQGNYPAAETSLQDYEKGVHQTLDLLSQVSDKPSSEVVEVVGTVKESFANNVQTLTAITERVPMNIQVKDHVRKAMTTSMDGAMMAGSVYQKLQQATLTPVIVATQIPLPSSPTAVPSTNTPIPTKPPKPTATPVPPTAVPPTATRPPKSTATTAPTETSLPTLAPSETPSAATDTPVATEAPVDTPTDLPIATDEVIPTVTTAIPVQATLVPTNTPVPMPTQAPLGNSDQVVTSSPQYTLISPTP
jgi:hypothetical protein